MNANSRAMTYQGSASVPIPYQAQHDGPRRVLYLQLKRALRNNAAVHVNIDGLAHVQRFGPAFFEIPADRPVTIRVHQFDVLQRVMGHAETVLPAGTHAALEYQAPAHPKEMGEIGPPGTTNVRGRARFYLFLGAILLLPVVLVFFMTLVFIAMLVRQEEASPPVVTKTATAEPTPTAAEPTPTRIAAAGPATSGVPVVVNGQCSDEIVKYMGENSTSSKFKSGFGRPALLDGLNVGCTAIAVAPSFAGYLDTFAFVRREDNIDDLLAKRILDLGYTRDSVPGVFNNAKGDPEGFIRVLGETGKPEVTKFADNMQWVVIQFYLPA